MRVAELQQFLGQIPPFARAAGASEKAVTELLRTQQFLEPFKDMSLAEFNDFLRLADEYHRTGKLTLPSTKGSGRARAAKAPAISIEDAAALFSELYKRATDPALTYAEIETKLKSFDKLTIPQLKELAGKVGVTVSGKTKKPILNQLASRITELKASFERGQQFRLGESA